MSFIMPRFPLPSQIVNSAAQKKPGAPVAAGPSAASQVNLQNQQQAVSNQQINAQLTNITMSLQMMQAKIDQIINILNRNAQAGADTQRMEQMAQAFAKVGRGRGGL